METRDGSSSPLQREGLRFFGHIAAGLSHEFSNVFNIINELAGLEQDIALAAATGSQGAATARIADLAGRIKAQIERAEALNRRLHAFAHTIDNAAVAFDLADVLDLLEALASRAARLGQVEIVHRPPPTAVTLEGDPFALLLALYAMVDIGLTAAASARRLALDAEAVADGARLTLTSADPLPPFEANAAAAAALELGRAAWGGAVTRDKVAGEDAILLTLPAVAPAGRSSNDAPGEDSHET